MLKDCLNKEPVLRAPNFRKWFILCTDVSETCLGVVLMQKDGNEMLQPVLYLSRKWEQRKRTFSFGNRKGMSIHCVGIRKVTVRPYLWGRKFVLMDHSPFCWLHKTRVLPEIY